MGIHGVFKQIGAGTRISLAKFSSDHFVASNRPLRLAIDISIWLFQIQSGKGGSNPALRTFYYRLLRLLTLNIHPLFVFDGPNKPTFKRNKKVGGPGVRVANVPEFLAKQLLKQFGFPWHVAPGEAEAECALLQNRSIVDAVLSEDVDTLMFGSGVTLRNWTPEGSCKTPTHVNVYRAEETKAGSGLDRHGMVLVALMSGGDYLPDGIPGCGPKLACDAARAGFGQELCSLDPTDDAAIRAWKERLEHEIHTNEAKYFSRKTPSFKMPDDFPNIEVLGYYTHPCVSTNEKLNRMRESLQWDLEIDYPALRTFTAEAFDWRCLGGAQKFIRNLAPAILTRRLRLQGSNDQQLDEDAQKLCEQGMIAAIHGKRKHYTTDGELEYRISFVPHQMVPIDLSQEEEDDEFHPAGVEAPEDELIADDAVDGLDVADDGQVTKARQARSYDPTQPEKIWVMRNFLQIGCPLTIELYESRSCPSKAKNTTEPRARPHNKKGNNQPQTNTLLRYTTVTKSVTAQSNQDRDKAADTQQRDTTDETHTTCYIAPVIGKDQAATSQCRQPTPETLPEAGRVPTRATFKLPRTLTSLATTARAEIDSDAFQDNDQRCTAPVVRSRTVRTQSRPMDTAARDEPRPVRRKRPSPELSSPVASQRTITAYYSPSPRRTRPAQEIVSLLSSSPPRPMTPTPTVLRQKFVQPPALRDRDINANLVPTADFLPVSLPDSVTKRRKKGPLRRHRTAPAYGNDFDENDARFDVHDELPNCTIGVQSSSVVEALDLTHSSPIRVVDEPQRLSLGGDQQDDDLEVISLHDDLHSSDNVQAAESLQRQSPAMASVLDCNKQMNPARRLHRLEDLPTTPRRSPRQAALRERIRLRESVDGAWRRVAEDPIGATERRNRGSGWRTSLIETLDMTVEE